MSYPQADEIRSIKTHARAIVLEALTDEDALSPEQRTRVVVNLRNTGSHRADARNCRFSTVSDRRAWSAGRRRHRQSLGGGGAFE